MDSIHCSEEVMTQSSELTAVLSQKEVYHLLYADVYAIVKEFVISRGGIEQDVNDLLQETFVIISSHKNLENLYSKENPKAYLVAIAKNLWNKEMMRKNLMKNCVKEFVCYDYSVDVDMQHKLQQRYDLYWNHFIRMGHECKLILREFFNRSKPQDISEKMGLTVNYYYKRKSICIKYLENKIKQDPKFKLLKQN